MLDKPLASEATLREIDLCVRDIVAEAFDEARAILMKRRADLDQGVELLLKNGEDFPAIRLAEADETPPVSLTLAGRRVYIDH
jgi:cell division protease FtsH